MRRPYRAGIAAGFKVGSSGTRVGVAVEGLTLEERWREDDQDDPDQGGAHAEQERAADVRPVQARRACPRRCSWVPSALGLSQSSCRLQVSAKKNRAHDPARTGGALPDHDTAAAQRIHIFSFAGLKGGS